MRFAFRTGLVGVTRLMLGIFFVSDVMAQSDVGIPKKNYDLPRIRIPNTPDGRLDERPAKRVASTNTKTANTKTVPKKVPPCFQDEYKRVTITPDLKFKTGPDIKAVVSDKDGEKTTSYKFQVFDNELPKWVKVQIVQNRAKGTTYVVESESESKNDDEFVNKTYSKLTTGKEGCKVDTKLDYLDNKVTYSQSFCKNAVEVAKKLVDCSDLTKKYNDLVIEENKRLSDQFTIAPKPDLGISFNNSESIALKVGAFCNSDILKSKAAVATRDSIPGLNDDARSENRSTGKAE